MTPAEYKLLTRAETAEFEVARLRQELESAHVCIARISYCNAQNGEDAMKMRSMAMDFMRPIEQERQRKAR